jgi:hypothetical protein
MENEAERKIEIIRRTADMEVVFGKPYERART